MPARSSVWIVLVWWSVAACSAARAESSGFGMLSLAPSRRDPGVYEDVADADYVVFAAGTHRVVARGRIDARATRVKVPAGRYEVELRLREERPLHAPILLGPIDVPANEIVGLIPEFALGSLRTFAMRGGSTVQRSYRLDDAAGVPIRSYLSTDDLRFGPSTPYTYPPGRYSVAIQDPTGGERRFEIELLAGESSQVVWVEDRDLAVLIEGGAVILRSATGARTVLVEPIPERPILELCVSPDGRRIAFVRSTPDTRVTSALEDVEATELWVSELVPGTARRLVEGRASRDPRRVIGGMHSLQFAPDGERIFFMTPAWMLSAAVHSVDVRTAKERFVTAASRYTVLRNGLQAGMLSVRQVQDDPLGRFRSEVDTILTPTREDPGCALCSGDLPARPRGRLPQSASFATATVIPIGNGASSIDLNLDGTLDLVFSAARANGNAHGFSYRTFYVSYAFEGPGFFWHLVPFLGRGRNPPDGSDGFRTEEGADCMLGDMRLLQIREGSSRRTLAVLAQRAFGESYVDSTLVTYSVYELRERFDELGSSPFHFQLLASFQSRSRYCDVNEAFIEDLGIRLPVASPQRTSKTPTAPPE